jgi:hypothetical protein
MRSRHEHRGGDMRGVVPLIVVAAIVAGCGSQGTLTVVP